MAKSKVYTLLSVRLSSYDHSRLNQMVREQARTKGELGREAIRWYLDHYQTIKDDERESELSKTLKAMTNRLCGMLARQGAQIGTLYQLAWENHEEAGITDRFNAAATTAKKQMRQKLDKDERQMSDGMKKEVADE